MIYITGDLHGDISRIESAYNQSGLFAKGDYLLICGDFGLLWDKKEDNVPGLQVLANMDFTILFIDGNHENFDMLNSYDVEKWHGGKVHRIKDNIFHLMRGQFFDIDGSIFFTLGGANSVNEKICREYGTWWADELPSQKELNEASLNLIKHNNCAEYIITHTCSTKTLQALAEEYGFLSGVKPNQFNDYLQSVEDTVEYKYWFFAHFHKNGGEIRKNQFLIYNEIILLP